MLSPERVELDDASLLAPRLPRAKRQLYLEVRAIDRVSHGVEKSHVTLEGPDRLGPFVAVRERQRDVVVEALQVGVLRQVAFADQRHPDQGVELPLVPFPARPLAGRGFPVAALDPSA